MTNNKDKMRDFKKELDTHCAKFMNSLQQYEEGGDISQRNHLLGVLDEELSLIRAVSQEITHAGVLTQQAKVEKDYRNYIHSRTSDDYSALCHNVQTLRDYIH